MAKAGAKRLVCTLEDGSEVRPPPQLKLNMPPPPPPQLKLNIPHPSCVFCMSWCNLTLRSGERQQVGLANAEQFVGYATPQHRLQLHQGLSIGVAAVS